MKNRIKIISLALLVAVFSSSCNDDLTNYKFVELTDEELSSENDSVKFLTLGKGAIWKMWKDLHKECMKNQWLKKSKYFGVSSTLKLGTITDKNFKKVHNTLDDIISDKELAYIIDEGAAQPCTYIRKVSFDLETELKMDVAGQNQELGLFLQNKTNTSVQIDGWQQQNVITDRLVEVMSADTASSQKKLYAERLKDKNSRLLSTVVRINGFTSEIQSTRAISPELKLQLDEGTISSVIGNTGIEVGFQFVDSLTIRTSTNNSFYIFGRYVKSKKL